MPLSKYFLLRRENNNRDEIFEITKIFIQNVVKGKTKYEPLKLAENVEDDKVYVIFNDKGKAVSVTLINQSDVKAELQGHVESRKRVIMKKKLSLNSDDSSRKSKTKKIKEDMKKQNKQEKQQLETAKEKVLNDGDAQFLEEVQGLQEPVSVIVKEKEKKRKSESKLLNPMAKKPASVDSSMISNTSSEDAIEIPEIESDDLSDSDSSSKSELDNKSMNSSPLHYGSEDDNDAKASKQSTSVFVDPMARTNTSPPARGNVLSPEVVVLNQKSQPNSTLQKNDRIANNDQNVTNGGENNSKAKTQNESKKVEVLTGMFLDNDNYSKAKNTTNMKTRLTSIMNGYWSDSEAAKFCIRYRSDYPNLKVVPTSDLNNIKNIYEKINLDASIKPSKKKGFDFDNFIRECASTNFKLRRQKIHNLNPLKKIETIDIEIEKLIDKQKRITKGLENKENDGKNGTKKNEDLLNKERELQKREKKVEEREKKILEYMNYLKSTHRKED